MITLMLGSGFRIEQTAGNRARYFAIALAIFLLAMGRAAGAEPKTSGDRPNILLILADDLAWSDVGCYGSRSCETPRLDRMAREGMRFTDAYAAAPICSPSRAAILTGKSPARLNFEFVTKWEKDRLPTRHALLPPPYTYNLGLDEVTVAEVLRAGGYRTAFMGKWHLNTHYKTYLGWSPTHGPLQQGFEYGLETFGSHPWADRAGEPQRYRDLEAGQYAPDPLTDAAVKFIAQAGERPFFLFVSTPYVHTPVLERGPWLQRKYRAKLGPAATEKQVTYCAFVETLDHYVGRLLDAVDAAGLAEDTLVVFTSDNGGHPEYADNAPLRGSKWNLYEGGIRVPLMVRRIGKIRPGSLSSRAVVGADLGPTLADLAGLEFADRSKLDGYSFAGELEGRGEQRAEPLIWHFPYYHPEKNFEESLDTIGVQDRAVSKTFPQSAIRMGNRKLLYFHEDASVELYDLESDPAESVNLAESDPAGAEALKARLLQELRIRKARFPAKNP